MTGQDAFNDLFAPEPSTPEVAQVKPWKILLVDDEVDVHAALRLVLQDMDVEGRPLHLLDAKSAEEAKVRLAGHPDIALILLDVVMETEQAGLDLVRHVRENLDNHAIQIVLVTGQPGYAPQREVVTQYAIDGYRLKSELTADKIFVSVYTTLRHYQTLVDLDQQRKELEASEQRYADLYDNAPDMYVSVEAATARVARCNQTLANKLGYEKSEIIGRSIFDLYHPDSLPKAQAAFRTFVETGEVHNAELQLKHRDGSQIDVNLNVTAVRDEAGKILCSRSSWVDITERKLVEAELARHRQHLEELVKSRTAELERKNRYLAETQFAMDKAGIGIHWIEVQTGRLLYVNDYACALLGYSREEMLGMHLSDIDPNFTEEDYPQKVAPLCDIGSATIETTERHKDGRVIPIEVTFFYQPGVEGQAGRFISFVTDISQRKQVEAALIRAGQDAEAANRAKSLFLANMSHELRTPLNAILGFAQIMARDDRIPADECKNIDTINRSGNHLLALINDVLDISRIEAGRTTVVNEPFDLAGVLNDVEEMTRLRAEAKGVSFVVDRPANLPLYVIGDAHHLRQVLINLLGNAIKFTALGEVGLRLQTEGTDIRFEVHDTGPGIPPEEQERIFSAFYQTEQSIALGEGAGLGLAISRAFVHLMGGELNLESVPGQGSNFSFRLALPSADIVPPAGNGLRVRCLAAGQRAPRILAAEDHPDSQAVIEQLLRRVGFDVRLAEDGEAALKLFQSWSPQLVLMDMRMPKMDGYAATQAIRALPGGKTVPIVALTASAFEEDRHRVLAVGCDDIVKKPFEEGLLFETISRMLDLRYEYEQPIADEELLPTGANLDRLPVEFLQQLAEAVVRLDKEAVMASLDQLQEEYSGEKNAIVSFVEDYRFDKVAELLDLAKQAKGSSN